MVVLIGIAQSDANGCSAAVSGVKLRVETPRVAVVRIGSRGVLGLIT